MQPTYRLLLWTLALAGLAADQGTDAFEQEFTLSLMKNQEEVLEEITEALDRISRGSFGRCEECQGAIPKARLQTIPYARLCVACARRVEQRL